jgi:hypothetical protein
LFATTSVLYYCFVLPNKACCHSFAPFVSCYLVYGPRKHYLGFGFRPMLLEREKTVTDPPKSNLKKGAYPMQTNFVHKLWKLSSQSLDPHPKVRLGGEKFSHFNPSNDPFPNHSLSKKTFHNTKTGRRVTRHR